MDLTNGGTQPDKDQVVHRPCCIWGIILAAVYLIIFMLCSVFCTYEYSIPWMIMVGVSYPAVLLSEPIQTMLNLPEWISILSLSMLMYFGLGSGLCRLIIYVSQCRRHGKQTMA